MGNVLISLSYLSCRLSPRRNGSREGHAAQKDKCQPAGIVDSRRPVFARQEVNQRQGELSQGALSVSSCGSEACRVRSTSTAGLCTVRPDVGEGVVGVGA